MDAQQAPQEVEKNFLLNVKKEKVGRGNINLNIIRGDNGKNRPPSTIPSRSTHTASHKPELLGFGVFFGAEPIRLTEFARRLQLLNLE